MSNRMGEVFHHLPILFSLAVVAGVVFLIWKTRRPQILLLAGGGILLWAAQQFGLQPVLEGGTGFWFLDLCELIYQLLQKDVGPSGLVIMTASAYATLMNQVGASDAMVRVWMKPLGKLRSPYLVLAMLYPLGQCFNLFLPSASGLSVLLMATAYPIVVELGVSPAAGAAVIATGAALDLGPASGASHLAAQMSGMDTMTYFLSYQLPVAALILPLITITHYFTQRIWDRREGYRRQENRRAAEGKDRWRDVPLWYAVLPLIPMLLLIVGSWSSERKIHVVPSMMAGTAVTILIEMVRHSEGGINQGSHLLDIFFSAMGRQFASILTLILSGEFFAEGIKHIGLLDWSLEQIQGWGMGVTPLLVAMVAIILCSCVVMGSGAAPFYAFIPLAPGISQSFGVSPVSLCLAMQLATGMGRNLSPVSSCMVATAGCAGVSMSSTDLVKRTIWPMLIGTLALIWGDIYLFL